MPELDSWVMVEDGHNTIDRVLHHDDPGKLGIRVGWQPSVRTFCTGRGRASECFPPKIVHVKNRVERFSCCCSGS